MFVFSIPVSAEDLKKAAPVLAGVAVISAVAVAVAHYKDKDKRKAISDAIAANRAELEAKRAEMHEKLKREAK